MNRNFVRAGVIGNSVLAPTLAMAHTGVGDTHGFTHGFLHPVSGIDHVLAMVAVGLFAAHLGGRALWLVPAAFVGMMAVGGALGMGGIDVPYVEIGIAMSVVVLGLAVAVRWNVPTATAMALVGVFAIFHGHAHGAEMPEDASGLGYAVGFMLATALLHAIGVGAGLAIGLFGERAGTRFAQAAGGAMALTGIGLLVGWM